VSLIGQDTVLKFDRANRLVDRLDFAVPGMLMIDTSSDRLYVGRSMSAVNPPKRIGVIDRTEMSVEEVDVFFPRPHALAVSPDGSTVYSASLAANQLARIDASTLELELTDLGGAPHTLVQFAVSPDGKTMVAGGQMSGAVLIFAPGEAGDLAPVDSVQIGGMPWHPTFDRTGRFVYFGNKGKNTVTVLDVQETAVERVISGEGLAEPHGSALSPDGRRLFISNNNLKGGYSAGDGSENTGTVVVIDTSSLEIIKVIEVGKNTTGIATLPSN
jgi:DNA-binding beta-propeller fold protein YncE